MVDNHSSLSEKIAAFITKLEQDQQTEPRNSSNSSYDFSAKENHINTELETILREISLLKEKILHTESAQTFHQSKQLLNENQTEIQSLHDLCHDTHTKIAAQCERLNSATMGILKNASQFLLSVKTSTLQKLVELKKIEADNLHQTHLQQIKNMMRGLGFKLFGTILFICIFVSLIVSFYADNEWPWQVHKQVELQREEGKALLSSWTYLSPKDKNIIDQETTT